MIKIIEKYYKNKEDRRINAHRKKTAMEINKMKEELKDVSDKEIDERVSRVFKERIAHFKNISIDCKCGKKVIPMIYKQSFDHLFSTFVFRLACEDNCDCSATEISGLSKTDEKSLKNIFNIMIQEMLVYQKEMLMSASHE